MNSFERPSYVQSSSEYEEYKRDLPEIKEENGKKYRRIDTGYTIREYFSHSTTKGPGPGWDARIGRLTKMGLDPFDTEHLPNDPYYWLSRNW